MIEKLPTIDEILDEYATEAYLYQREVDAGVSHKTNVMGKAHEQAKAHLEKLMAEARLEELKQLLDSGREWVEHNEGTVYEANKRITDLEQAMKGENDEGR